MLEDQYKMPQTERLHKLRDERKTSKLRSCVKCVKFTSIYGGSHVAAVK